MLYFSRAPFRNEAKRNETKRAISVSFHFVSLRFAKRNEVKRALLSEPAKRNETETTESGVTKNARFVLLSKIPF